MKDNKEPIFSPSTSRSVVNLMSMKNNYSSILIILYRQIIRQINQIIIADYL